MLKATPITRKASSACKMNMDLIQGDREVQRKMTKKVGFSEAAEAAGSALGGDAPKEGQSGGAVEQASTNTDPAPSSTNTDPAPSKGQADNSIDPN